MAMMPGGNERLRPVRRALRDALMRTRRFLPAVDVVIATVVAATAGTRWPAVAADVETPAGERTAAAAFRLPPRPERSADERSRLAA